MKALIVLVLVLLAVDVSAAPAVVINQQQEVSASAAGLPYKSLRRIGEKFCSNAYRWYSERDGLKLMCHGQKSQIVVSWDGRVFRAAWLSEIEVLGFIENF